MTLSVKTGHGYCLSWESARWVSAIDMAVLCGVGQTGCVTAALDMQVSAPWEGAPPE